METLKSWAFSIAVAAVVATIAQMLIPKGNLEKMVKITLSAFMLSVMLSPILVKVDFAIKPDDSFETKMDNYTKELENQMSEMIETQLSQQIETLISSQLGEIGVSPTHLAVSVVADGANSAEIVEVEVRLKKDYKIKDADIRYRIKNIADCQITLVYTEG